MNANPTKRPQYVVLFPDLPTIVQIDPVSAGTFPYWVPTNGSVSYQLATLIPGWQPMPTHINMYGVSDCTNYINKIASFGSNYSPGKLVVSASGGGYSNIIYCLDDGSTHGSGQESYDAAQTLTNQGVPISDVYYGPSDTTVLSITNATNVTGYWSDGTHGHVTDFTFPINTNLAVSMVFDGQSDWYVMTTLESFNGYRYQATSPTSQSSFLMWFYPNAFGGTNYSDTPVGAISHVGEPGGSPNLSIFYGDWAQGKNFAICAWSAGKLTWIQATGDPFLTK